MAAVKIQLCGRFAFLRDGRRIEDDLPGRQGRLLVAYLVLNRNRPVRRDDVIAALWANGRDAGVAPLLSKVRRVVPLDGLRPVLPADAWVDVEAAAEAVHRAESALAQGRPARAWGPAQVALFATGRPLLPGEDGEWLDEERRRLDALHLRALESYAGATLGVGGTELPAAVRAARELVRLEPFRESGWRLLLRALAAEGNVAEALREYDRLRVLLRDELGINPGPETQALHRELLL